MLSSSFEHLRTPSHPTMILQRSLYPVLLFCVCASSNCRYLLGQDVFPNKEYRDVKSHPLGRRHRRRRECKARLIFTITRALFSFHLPVPMRRCVRAKGMRYGIFYKRIMKRNDMRSFRYCLQYKIEKWNGTLKYTFTFIYTTSHIINNSKPQ